MAAKYILAVVAALFLIASGRSSPQRRTWLTIAAIFGVVSAWLFVRG